MKDHELVALSAEIRALDTDSAEGRRRLFELIGPLKREELLKLAELSEAYLADRRNS